LRRRDFLISLGGAAAAGPLAAQAQTPDATKRLGVLSPYPESDKSIQAQLSLFRSALGQLGWSEGHNLRIDYRWAGGDMNRLTPLARELVELRPNALLVRATPGAVAAMRATRTIPIVFVVVSDPVGDGLVTSIAHPGGNVTGFTNGLEESIGGKWIEILREIARAARGSHPRTGAPCPVTEAYRLAGTYTGRILKGDKPAELPVQQLTKVELYINLKTAKTLGVTVPTALLVRADEVIE
jgi:ABC-type uncharacterized transport system substrate-binding protein